MSDIWSIISPKDKYLQPYNPQHMKIVEIDEKVALSAHLQQDVGANKKGNRIMGSPMKTLIVKYIPRNEQSNTKKLLDAFREEISISDVEELDLLDDVPDMLLDNNLLAHLNRNILGLELLPDEEKLLSKMDRMAAQLKSADIVVMAFPMYNFSMPAIVKAWFDSVIQKGVTFGARKDDQMVISNAGKKALTLISSGGVYSNESFSGREHALSLSNLEFQYMGYSDVRGILAEGMAMNEEIKETNLNKSIRELRAIAREWYKKEEYDSMCVNLISKKRRFGNV
jgi:FMN-dependent NADH-azoreductase